MSKHHNKNKKIYITLTSNNNHNLDYINKQVLEHILNICNNILKNESHNIKYKNLHLKTNLSILPINNLSLIHNTYELHTKLNAKSKNIIITHQGIVYKPLFSLYGSQYTTYKDKIIIHNTSIKKLQRLLFLYNLYNNIDTLLPYFNLKIHHNKI